MQAGLVAERIRGAGARNVLVGDDLVYDGGGPGRLQTARLLVKGLVVGLVLRGTLGEWTHRRRRPVPQPIGGKVLGRVGPEVLPLVEDELLGGR